MRLPALCATPPVGDPNPEGPSLNGGPLTGANVSKETNLT